MSDLDWQQHGLCIGISSDLFFPERGEDVRVAKAVCAGCPVRTECLNYALANEEKFGVWGGTSERERRRMRSSLTYPRHARPLAPIDHGTDRGYLQHRRRGVEPCDACREARSRRIVAWRQNKASAA